MTTTPDPTAPDRAASGTAGSDRVASLTGHADTDALVAEACQLIWAVREDDHKQVAGVLAAATAKSGGDPVRAAQLLAVVLAGMCPDDITPCEAFAWRLDPDAYHRMRAQGVPALGAANALRIRTDSRTVA